MKKIFILINLLLASTSLSAMGCMGLVVTVDNASTHNCTLKYSTTTNGENKEDPPKTIPAGTTSQGFLVQCDASSDHKARIYLDYQCDTQSVLFDSISSCGMFGSDVTGKSFVGNDVKVDFQTKLGSYWYGLPNQITWTIH